MVVGTPKRLIQWRRRALETESASDCCRGMASHHRVKQSTAVKRKRQPFDSGSGPTKSMWTCEKRESGGRKCAGVCAVWRWTFERWHGTQDRVQAVTSRFIFSQTYLDATRWREARIPGCVVLCSVLKTARRYADGRYGRGVPVEKSQTRGWAAPGSETSHHCKEHVGESRRCCNSGSACWSTASWLRLRSCSGTVRASTRERASATGLFTPEMCWMSVVNSEIKARCRISRGECREEDVARE